jgi:hypothetical protein
MQMKQRSKLRTFLMGGGFFALLALGILAMQGAASAEVATIYVLVTAVALPQFIERIYDAKGSDRIE